MKYVIVYWSRFGNNRKIAARLEALLKPKGEIITLVAADSVKLPQADVYVFSAAAERFSIQEDMKKLMSGLRGMEGKKYALINTHALGFKSWLGRMNKLLAKSGLVKLAETDFRVGGGTKEGNGLPQGWEKKLEEFTNKI